jgi:hypothetical protein
VARWARDNGLEEEPQFMRQPGSDSEYPMDRKDTPEDQKFRQQLTEDMKTRGIITTDFNTTPKETLEYMTELYDRVKADFPRIGEVLKGIYCSYSTLTNEEAAMFKPENNSIWYNQRIFASKENLLHYLNKIPRKFASTEIPSVMAHELGHAIEKVLIKLSGNKYFVRDELSEMNTRNKVTWGMVEQQLSLYAVDPTFHDTIAEAMSQFLAEKKPSNISKAVYNKLILLYRSLA